MKFSRDAIFILCYSGGKDSTAAVVYLLKERRLKNVLVVFCDTGNESPDTYQYIDYISTLLVSWGHPPIITLQGEYSFYSLAKKKKRFPSIKARFCTEWLKIVPKCRWIEEQEFEKDPILVMGIRKEESPARSSRQEWENSTRVFGQTLWNPLIDWTVEQVFDIHRRYGVEINPMYRLGFKRVGCFPCVNAGRLELKLLEKHYPERIDEIERWEKELGRTYFAPRKKDGVYHGVRWHVLWALRSDPHMSPLPLFEEEKLCAYADLGVCE